MTFPLTDEQLKDMLAGCESVTPGPWLWIDHANALVRVGRRIMLRDGDWGNASIGDRAHITRCDPQTISSLVTELLELRAERGKE